MSSQMSIVVLTPNGRRNTVKCNQNTTILQILEQTCTKHEFEPSEYDLTHHGRVIDASAILRFSGLPNNAFLEMAPAKRVRQESEAVIGLQLENGSRVMGTFSPSTDLLTILNKLAPAESDPDSNPVIIYMRREVFSVENLKATTLKSLGLTGGRAALRLVHRTPEQLKIQANVSAPIPSRLKDIDDVLMADSHQRIEKKEVIQPIQDIPEMLPRNIEQTVRLDVLPNADISEKTVDSTSVIDEIIEQNGITQTVKTKSTDTSEMEIESISSPEVLNSIEETKEYNYCEDIIILGERNALVFSQNLASRFSYDDLPDDFYDLSVPEVKKLFVELGQKRAELENVPLQTSSLRSFEEDKRIIKQLHDYKKVILRILFPDRIVLQGDFKPLDAVSVVKDFVKSFLESPDEPFDLYVTPPKQILKPEMSLVDADCVPCALIHFGPRSVDRLTDVSPVRQYLKDEILFKLSSPEAASFSASKLRGIKKLSNSFSGECKNKFLNKCPPVGTSKSKIGQANCQESVQKQPKDPSVPKWFKPT